MSQDAKKWKLHQVGITTGFISDYISNLSVVNLKGFAYNAENYDRDLNGFQLDNEGSIFGLSIGVNISLVPFNEKRGFYNTNQEFRLGINLFTLREAMVTYSKDFSYNDTSVTQSGLYCLIDKEMSLTASYRYRLRLGPLSIYGGVGGSLGTSRSEFIFSESTVKTFVEYTNQYVSTNENIDSRDPARRVFYGRLYIPMGISAQTSKKMEIGIETTKGIGFQGAFGHRANFIESSSGWYFTMRYTFKTE